MLWIVLFIIALQVVFQVLLIHWYTSCPKKCCRHGCGYPSAIDVPDRKSTSEEPNFYDSNLSGHVKTPENDTKQFS